MLPLTDCFQLLIKFYLLRVDFLLLLEDLLGGCCAGILEVCVHFLVFFGVVSASGRWAGNAEAELGLGHEVSAFG